MEFVVRRRTSVASSYQTLDWVDVGVEEGYLEEYSSRACVGGG